MRGRRWSRRLVVLATVGIVAAATWFPGVNAQAGTPDRAEELLLRAREVSAQGSFVGVVEVTWRDDTGATQSERIVARGIEGAFLVGIGDQSSHGEGDERFTKGEGDEQTRAHGKVGGEAPAPSAAWDLEVVARRRVADRPAVVIAARDDDGQSRAKYAIDRETGQLLRRAVLDRNGRAVRVVAFVTIATAEGASPPEPSTSAPASVLGSSQVEAPVPIDSVPAGFVERSKVADSYRLLGRYLQPDGGVQLYYGDGLFTLSVFQAEGRIAWDTLLAGQPTSVEGLRSRAYATASGTIVVWGQRELVITVIGDGPRDRVMAAVADFSGRADEGSWLDDAVDFVLGPFDWD